MTTDLAETVRQEQLSDNVSKANLHAWASGVIAGGLVFATSGTSIPWNLIFGFSTAAAVWLFFRAVVYVLVSITITLQSKS